MVLEKFLLVFKMLMYAIILVHVWWAGVSPAELALPTLVACVCMLTGEGLELGRSLYNSRVSCGLIGIKYIFPYISCP